jgi:ABC-type glycerol-3-phosphate transport system substrate-binding protein
MDRQRVQTVDPDGRSAARGIEVVHQGRRAVSWDEINVVSETLTTHEYESKVLAKAFTEITGIKLTHDLLQEGDVVEKLQTGDAVGQNIYDGWSTTRT